MIFSQHYFWAWKLIKFHQRSHCCKCKVGVRNPIFSPALPASLLQYPASLKGHVYPYSVTPFKQHLCIMTVNYLRNICSSITVWIAASYYISLHKNKLWLLYHSASVVWVFFFSIKKYIFAYAAMCHMDVLRVVWLFLLTAFLFVTLHFPLKILAKALENHSLNIIILICHPSVLPIPSFFFSFFF